MKPADVNSFETEKQSHEVTRPDECFVVIAVRQAVRGERETLLAEVDKLMQKARHSPGFINVDVLESFDDPDVLVHYEMWASKRAHDEFDSGPIHAAFAQRVAPLVAHHNIPIHYRLCCRYIGTGSMSPESP